MNLNTIRRQVLARAAQSASFRAELLEDANTAIESETGWPVPSGFSITVREDPAEGLRVTVSGAVPLSDEQLVGVAGGESSEFETEEEANAAWQERFPGTTPPWAE